MTSADRLLAGRYARALFAWAAARKEETAVAAYLAACSGALSRALPLLRDPRVPAAAKKSLDRFRDVRVIEVRTVPEGCVTLEDAERAMIIAATQGAMSMKDILAAAKKLNMGNL